MNGPYFRRKRTKLYKKTHVVVEIKIIALGDVKLPQLKILEGNTLFYNYLF